MVVNGTHQIEGSRRWQVRLAAMAVVLLLLAPQALRVGADEGGGLSWSLSSVFESVGHNALYQYDRVARTVGSVRLAWQLFHLRSDGQPQVTSLTETPAPFFQACTDSAASAGNAKAGARAFSTKLHKVAARLPRKAGRASQVVTVIAIVRTARG